jgi:hypothetical protein
MHVLRPPRKTASFGAMNMLTCRRIVVSQWEGLPWWVGGSSVVRALIVKPCSSVNAAIKRRLNLHSCWGIWLIGHTTTTVQQDAFRQTAFGKFREKHQYTRSMFPTDYVQNRTLGVAIRIFCAFQHFSFLFSTTTSAPTIIDIALISSFLISWLY